MATVECCYIKWRLGVCFHWSFFGSNTVERDWLMSLYAAATPERRIREPPLLILLRQHICRIQLNSFKQHRHSLKNIIVHIVTFAFVSDMP